MTKYLLSFVADGGEVESTITGFETRAEAESFAEENIEAVEESRPWQYGPLSYSVTSYEDGVSPEDQLSQILKENGEDHRSSGGTKGGNPPKPSVDSKKLTPPKPYIKP